jgi:ribonucleoside-diphosphate reductase alpha chain
MAKEGSTVGALIQPIGIQSSFLRPFGVAPDAVVSETAYTRFDPFGFTGNPDIPTASSLIDDVFRRLGMEFIPRHRKENSPAAIEEARQQLQEAPAAVEAAGSAGHARRRVRGRRTAPRRPVRRAAVRQLRRAHDPLRHPLQMRELRKRHGMLVIEVV